MIPAWLNPKFLLLRLLAYLANKYLSRSSIVFRSSDFDKTHPCCRKMHYDIANDHTLLRKSGNVCNQCGRIWTGKEVNL